MKAMIKIGKQILTGCLRSRSLSLIAFYFVALCLFVLMLQTSDSAFKPKLIIDSGLSLINMFGLIFVAFVVLPVYGNEKDRRTLSATLSFPVTRAETIWGVMAGTTVALLINFIIMAIIFIIMLFVMKVTITLAIFRQLLLTLMALSVLTSFAICFSVMFGYVVAAMTTAGFFILGNLTTTLQQAIASYKGSIFHGILNALSNILPNLSLFDLKDIVVKNAAIPMYYELIAGIYAIALILIAMEITVWRFSKETIL